MAFPNHPHSGPAGAPPNMATSFGAMSLQEPPPQEPRSVTPGNSFSRRLAVFGSDQWLIQHAQDLGMAMSTVMRPGRHSLFQLHWEGGESLSRSRYFPLTSRHKPF